MPEPRVCSNTIIRFEAVTGAHLVITELDTGRKHEVKEKENGELYIESYYKSGERVEDVAPEPEPTPEPEPVPEPEPERGFLGLAKR